MRARTAAAATGYLGVVCGQKGIVGARRRHKQHSKPNQLNLSRDTGKTIDLKKRTPPSIPEPVVVEEHPFCSWVAAAFLHYLHAPNRCQEKKKAVDLLDEDYSS